MLFSHRAFILLATFLTVLNGGVLCGSEARELDRRVVFELIAQRDTSILHITEEKQFFLNPDCILVNNEGAFLITAQGEHLRIPFLLSSPAGCFISFDNEIAAVYPIIRCKNCGTPFNPSVFNGGKCPKCGAQN